MMEAMDFAHAATPGTHEAGSFEPAVAKVLEALRQTIAGALDGIGDFGKPADIFKTLQLDRTLARQLFRLASLNDPIGHGGMIPSRTSINRFLDAVKARGASEPKISAVREAYRVFEALVQTHAGDRATFNSMVSAAGGLDDDWLATDLQHRRNAFRAMSHALGQQTKTRLSTFLVNGRQGSGTMDTAIIGGSIGLRVLRTMSTVRVFAAAGDSLHDTSRVLSRPIGLSTGGGGYLIESASSSPLPQLFTRQGDAPNGLACEVIVRNPVVGNIGSATLMFGNVYSDVPLDPTEPLRLHTSVNQPVEKLIMDVLIHPDLRPGRAPRGGGVIGFQMGAHNQYGPGLTDIQGHFQPEFLGLGARAASSLEVPGYVDMLHAVDGKLGWGLQNFEAWRIRVDYPLFQSTVTVNWPAF